MADARMCSAQCAGGAPDLKPAAAVMAQKTAGAGPPPAICHIPLDLKVEKRL
jgi:hypothetical protein